LNTERIRYNPPSVGLSTGGIVHLVLLKSFRFKSMLGVFFFAVGMALFSALAIEDHGNQGFREYREFMYELFLLNMLPFFVMVTAGGILRNEIKDGTLEYIWTRPISRLRVMGGFFAAAIAATFIWVFFLSLGVQAGAMYHGIEGIWAEYDRLLLAVFAGCVAFSGLAMLVAAFSGKFVGFGLLYIGLVEIGIGKIPTNINNIAIRHHMETIVGSAFGEGGGSIASGLWGSFLIAAIFVFLAGFLFRNKNYSLGSEKED